MKRAVYPRNSLIKPERRRVLSIHIGGVSLTPVVKRTGLGSLCLIRSGGVSRVCVGVVESCKKSCNIREIPIKT